MTVAVQCPVCGRAGIEVEACPNCQAELAVLRMLHSLPTVADPQPSPPRSPGAPWAGAVACLVGGIALGALAFRPAVVSIQPVSMASSAATPQVATLLPATVAQSSSVTQASGFRYRVRRGDSYWAIAGKLYGDPTLHGRIVRLSASERGMVPLQPGEWVLVPNLEDVSSGGH